MALTKWDPLEMEWPERLRRWFDLDTDPAKWMRVEEMRDGDEVVVRAEMPGLDPDKDIEVWVADGLLHITATREMKSEHQDKAGMRSEFHYGQFSRTLALPDGVHRGAVKATYRDGILEVRVPCEKETLDNSTKIPVMRG